MGKPKISPIKAESYSRFGDANELHPIGSGGSPPYIIRRTIEDRVAIPPMRELKDMTADEIEDLEERLGAKVNREIQRAIMKGDNEKAADRKRSWGFKGS